MVAADTKEEPSATRAVIRLQQFLEVRDPVEPASVVILFPEQETDIVTQHAARIFVEARAQYVLLIAGRNGPDLAHAQAVLERAGVPHTRSYSPPISMGTQAEIASGIRYLGLDCKLTIDRIAVVCAPHKGRRFKGMVEVAVRPFVQKNTSVFCCPPEDSLPAFLPPVTETADAARPPEERIATLLAEELQHVVMRSVRKELVLEGGIPMDLSQIAGRFCSREQSFHLMNRRTLV